MNLPTTAVPLRSLGIKRLFSPKGGARTPLSALRNPVFISTIGPYDPTLFARGRFSAEKAMVDGYLAIHARLAREGLPSVLLVRDVFARAMRLSNGGYASATSIKALLKSIQDYSSKYVAKESGSPQAAKLFRVELESAYSDFNDVAWLRNLYDFRVGGASAARTIESLDLITGLDVILGAGKWQFVHALGKTPAHRVVAKRWPGKHTPVLLEWEGTVATWKTSKLRVGTVVAEVETFPGKRNTRAFYQASLDRLKPEGGRRAS